MFANLFAQANEAIKVTVQQPPEDHSVLLYALTGFFTLATSIATMVSVYFMTKLNAQIKANEELQKRKDSSDDIAKEAVQSAHDVANYVLKKEGKQPLIPLAPVIPESSSPSTEQQRDDARIQTHRASLAAIRLAFGLAPRKHPEESESET